MNWKDLVQMLRYVDNKGLAALMSVMWQAASERADEATQGNMLMNQMDPYAVAQALDWDGVRPDNELAQMFSERRGPPLHTLRPLPPFGGGEA